jgi:hypothetical protein
MSDDARNKTQRNTFNALDMSGALALGFSEKTFQTLNNDAVNALKRPWHKLERGLRIGRLREYVARETEKMKLCDEDSQALFKLLCVGLDRKMLSSKAAVTYDHEKEQITEVKGLVSHSAATGRTKYQLLEKKATGTQKKRSSKETPTPISSDGP